MLSSELEAQLKELREKHGDLPVLFPNRSYCSDCEDHNFIWQDVNIVGVTQDILNEEDGTSSDYIYVDYE